MPRVHRLPDAIVNQIAAGEVVERPASVVKELVENALDAGARSIAVTLVEGGRDLVEVSDDGCGMEAEDARLALERHATSKIASAADLDAIATLGFRGEALPSIAAAARVVLETAAVDGPGTRIEVAFGRLVEERPCARARGTRVAVHELFARLPARRKFLRAAATELRHAVTMLTGLACTHPGVAFTLRHGERTVLQLPPAANVAARLPDLLGARRAASAVPFAHVSGDLRVAGYLVPTRSARQLVAAVNGRVVRDRLLVAAVNRALGQPGVGADADVILSVELAAGEVDVNVHPTKAEVRFRDPGRVMSALAAALADGRVRLAGPVAIRRVVTVPAPYPAGTWKAPWAAPSLPLQPGAPAGVAEAEPVAAPPPVASPWGVYLGQYRESYLLLEDDRGLVLVDQHVAHERVLYERLLERGPAGGSQGLLIAELVELPPALAALAAELEGELSAFGLEVEAASGGTVRVLAVPASLPAIRPGVLLERLLADLAEARPGASVRERAAASMACQAAIKKNRPITRPEAARLLHDLAACLEPHRCPHGRPILLRLDHDEIERRIGRR